MLGYLSLQMKVIKKLFQLSACGLVIYLIYLAIETDAPQVGDEATVHSVVFYCPVTTDEERLIYLRRCLFTPEVEACSEDSEKLYCRWIEKETVTKLTLGGWIAIKETIKE